MVLVVFTNVPKQYKKDFKIGLLGNSKQLDVVEANQIVRKIAKELEEPIKFSFSLLEDKKTQFADIKDATLDNEAAQSGLIEVLDRVAEEQGNSEDSMAAFNLVSSALHDESDNTEEFEDNSLEEDDPSDTEFELSEADLSDDDLSDEDPWGNNIEENENHEEESSTLDGASPADDVETSNLSEDSEDLINSPSNEVIELPSQQPTSSVPLREDNTKYDSNNINVDLFKNEKLNNENVETTNESQVVTRRDYLDTEKIFENISGFSVDKFDLKDILNSLGYKEIATDKYERKLNAAILKDLDELGLTNLKEHFSTQKEKLKSEVNLLLGEQYDDAQSLPIAQVVENNTSELIGDLQNTASADKEDYATQSQNKIDHKKIELNHEIEDKVADYQHKLEQTAQAELNDFRKSEQEDLKSYNKVRDEKLDQDIKEIKSKSEQEEIHRRNSVLMDNKREITQSFYKKLTETYDIDLQKFTEGVKQLRKDALLQAKAIDKEKEADQAAERKRQMEDEDRRERKRQNDLKERELQLKEKNAEEQRKIHEKELKLKEKKYEEAAKARLEKEEKDFNLRKKKFELDQKRQEELPKAIIEAITQGVSATAKSQQAVFEAQARQMGMPIPKSSETISETAQPEKENSSNSDHLIKSEEDNDEPDLVEEKGENAEEVDTPIIDSDESANDQEDDYEDHTLKTSECSLPATFPEDGKKTKKRKPKLGLITGICVATLLGGLGWYGLVTQHSSQEQPVELQRAPKHKNSKEKAEASSQSKSKKKKSKKNSSTKSQKKKSKKSSVSVEEKAKSDQKQIQNNGENQAQTQAQESDTLNNLNNYQAATTWAQKVDVLNACLGQHDDRALKQINDSDPSKLSQLYEAITLQQDDSVRNIWLSMTHEEKQNMSRMADSATALAFYNVSDWEHGWEARNGI